MNDVLSRVLFSRHQAGVKLHETHRIVKMSIALEILTCPLSDFAGLFLVVQLLQRSEDVAVQFQTLLTEDKLHKSGLYSEQELSVVCKVICVCKLENQQ